LPAKSAPKKPLRLGTPTIALRIRSIRKSDSGPLLPLPPLLRDPIEDASVVNPPYILFLHPSILRPQHDPSDTPFKDHTAPTNDISYIPLPANHCRNFTDRDVVSSTGILEEDFFELLRDEAAFIVVGSRVAAMLGTINVWHVDPKEWVGNPGAARWVREVDVDYVKSDQRHENVEAQRAEAPVCITGPEDAIMVRVEEVTVLLEDGLVRVFLVP
jgi:hypothetical protein